jgi:hypothetical protein
MQGAAVAATQERSEGKRVNSLLSVGIRQLDELTKLKKAAGLAEYVIT